MAIKNSDTLCNILFSMILMEEIVLLVDKIKNISFETMFVENF